MERTGQTANKPQLCGLETTLHRASFGEQT
jgi:hypothetical protein